MLKDFLYESEDGNFRVTYLHDSKTGKVMNEDDYELWIKGKNREWIKHVLPDNELEYLLKNFYRFEKGLNSVDSSISKDLQEQRLEAYSLFRALYEASLEDAKRYLISIGGPGRETL